MHTLTPVLTADAPASRADEAAAPPPLYAASEARATAADVWKQGGGVSDDTRGGRPGASAGPTPARGADLLRRPVETRSGPPAAVSIQASVGLLSAVELSLFRLLSVSRRGKTMMLLWAGQGTRLGEPRLTIDPPRGGVQH